MASPAKAFVSGCAGPGLTADETAFFRDERPFGLILFGRNCREPAEVRDLVASFREAVGRPEAPVLIDQEGGRVQRLRPPAWPAYAAAGVIGRLAAEDAAAGERAAWLHGRLIADDLAGLGIDVNCAPVLDVATDKTADVIGDRSFAPDADVVAVLGRAMANGLLDGGVVPVMKHVPGHGRATADSHLDLPVVDADLDTLAASDFVPFAKLSDLPMAMTAHIVFSAIDSDNAATVSRAVIRDIIRKRISFDGLLLSDDVSMHALSGDYSRRAATIYAAGCDIVLHCNGRTQEMRAVAHAAPALDGVVGERAAGALTARKNPARFDSDKGREEYLALLSRVGWPATNAAMPA